MIFETPQLSGADVAAVQRVDELRRALAHQVAVPRRWLGSLRRITRARAVQASNSIEGINASLDDVVAAEERESPLDATTETFAALRGYQTAMTYVLQLARSSEAVVVDSSLIRALHFMIASYDLSANPGVWRSGPLWVERDPGNAVVYEGPPVELVPGLVDELVVSLSDDAGPVIVRAAMAHLNLVMIHPFSDGNGRMARCLQSLVLTQEHLLAPEFSSIEEFLGDRTQAYYDVLANVGQGSWNPGRDATPWVRFCLDAHEQQARRLLQRLQDFERLWEQCAALASRHRLPERVVPALVDAARGLRLRNSGYRNLVLTSQGEEITENTASRDLRAMVEAGVLEPRGERRGRLYVAGIPLIDAWRDVRSLRPASLGRREATLRNQDRLPGL